MSPLPLPQLGPAPTPGWTPSLTLFCSAVALFSLVGFTQMTIWAKGKHRSYLKEFRDYPPLRMPIIPFLL